MGINSLAEDWHGCAKLIGHRFPSLVTLPPYVLPPLSVSPRCAEAGKCLAPSGLFAVAFNQAPRALREGTLTSLEGTGKALNQRGVVWGFLAPSPAALRPRGPRCPAPRGSLAVLSSLLWPPDSPVMGSKGQSWACGRPGGGEWDGVLHAGKRFLVVV